MDIGGDDRGAYALGRYVPYIVEENNFDALFVVNFYRPLTQDAESAYEVMGEIESACGLKLTGIVNNSNIPNLLKYFELLWLVKIYILNINYNTHNTDINTTFLV
jgi:hypothetical protein